MCVLRYGPSKRLKIIKKTHEFIAISMFHIFVRFGTSSFLHIKPMVFFIILFLRTSFWAPCSFVVAVFLQKQMVFASFMYYICSSLFHFEISSFMQKNVCFSHFRPRINNLDISSFVTRPGWYSFFRRHVRTFFIFTHWCHLEIASNMYGFYTFGLGRKPSIFQVLSHVPSEHTFIEIIVLFLKQNTHIYNENNIIFSSLYVVVSRFATRLTKYCQFSRQLSDLLSKYDFYA